MERFVKYEAASTKGGVRHVHFEKVIDLSEMIVVQDLRHFVVKYDNKEIVVLINITSSDEVAKEFVAMIENFAENGGILNLSRYQEEPIYGIYV
ncbi:MAG: hypothetical protein E7485_08340 [Ruminococcaceae bacterium]|nr:hypothetical protein [Oscillospiraceae bacterium]